MISNKYNISCTFFVEFISTHHIGYIDCINVTGIFDYLRNGIEVISRHYFLYNIKTYGGGADWYQPYPDVCVQK